MHWKEWLHHNPDEKLEIIEQLVIDNAVLVDATRMSSITTATLARVLDKLTPPPVVNKMRPVLSFNILINNTNFTFMAVITSLTLTSPAPVTLFMTVLDSSNGNAPIAGTLTGLAYTPADPTQDLAVVDPADATMVDIHAVAPKGGTALVANGNFVSTLQKADGTGPAFSGALPPVTLTIVNNVVVAATITPVLAFNQ